MHSWLKPRASDSLATITMNVIDRATPLKCTGVGVSAISPAFDSAYNQPPPTKHTMATTKIQPDTFAIACMAWNGRYHQSTYQVEVVKSTMEEVDLSTSSCPAFETHHLSRPSTLNKFVRKIWRWLGRHAPLMGEIEGRYRDICDEENLMNGVRKEVAHFTLEYESLEVVQESYLNSLRKCDTTPTARGNLSPVLESKEVSTSVSTPVEAPLESESEMIPLTPAQIAESMTETVKSVACTPKPQVVNQINARIVSEVRVALNAKLGFLPDSNVNRLLVEKTALKIMKDNNFRNMVVSTHLKFICSAYFGCRVEEEKAGGARRKCSNWLLRLMGFSTDNVTST